LASARTTCRPMKPEPPNTVTSFGVSRISVMVGSGGAFAVG
jgi:hypothetical protein